MIVLIYRPAIDASDALAFACAFFALFVAIVAVLTNRLQFAVPEQVGVTFVRCLVVSYRGCRYPVHLHAHAAQRFAAKLVSASGLPSCCAIPRLG